MNSTSSSVMSRAVIWGLLAVLAVALIFGRTMTYDFSPWDDEVNIVHNASYQKPLTPETLQSFWRRDYHNQYMPVTWTAWAFCAEAGRGTYVRPEIHEQIPFGPVPFHVLALGCHLGCVAIVFCLLRRLIVSTSALPAFFGALLFGLHPLQTEAAVWINGGNITLAYLFGFGAILAFDIAATTERKPYSLFVFTAATLLYALALLAKPTAVSVLLIALGVTVGLRRVPIRKVAPLLALWLVIGMATILVNSQGKIVLPTAQSSPILRPFVAGDALAFYIGKALFPLKLACSYARTPRIIFADGYGYFLWLIPVGIAVALWIIGKVRGWSESTRRNIAVVGFLFVAGVLPTLGFIPFYYQYHSTVADRYAYPALFAPALILTWILVRAEKSSMARPVFIGATALLLICAGRSFLQTATWQSGVTVFSNAVKVAPRSPDMHFNLAIQLTQRNQLSEAAQEYQKAIQCDPKYVAAYTNLGTLLTNGGQPDLGAKAHEAALRLDPNQGQSNYWLGVYHADRKQWKQAADYYRTALQSFPGDQNIIRRLAEAEAKTPH